MALALGGWNQQAKATAYSIDCTTTAPVTLNSGALVVPNHDLTSASNTSYNQIVSLAASTGTAQGYNNSVSTPFTENSTGPNPSGKQIKLSQLAKVNIGGTIYYQILFDIKGGHTCAFTDIRVYVGPNADPNVTSVANLGNLGTLVYSLSGNTLGVSTLFATSNKTQFALMIPVASTGTLGGVNDVNNNVYIYVSGTGFGGNQDNVNLGADLSQTNTTPEAHTVWGGISMALLLGFGYARQRFLKPKPSVG